MRRPSRWVLGSVVLVLGLAGIVLLRQARPAGVTEPAPLVAPASFGTEPIWAQHHTVHIGGRTFGVGRWQVRTLRPTAYGVFVDVARTLRYDERGSDGLPRWRFLDARGLHRLPGDVESPPVVSPDGRYAGWVDFHGPRRPAGRIAQVVVVDLRTGKRVLADHEGMGGSFGDDLGDRYEELPPTFAGFDETYAHWVDASGNGHSRRARLRGNHDSEREQRAHPAFPLVGTEGSVENGRFRTRGSRPGTLSPDRRWAFVAFYDDLDVWENRSGSLIRLDAGGAAVRFGGWTGPDRFFAVVTAKRSDSTDAAGDRRPARLVSCSLPSGRCAELARVSGPDSVALGVPEQR